jgi:hypothetical protein
MGHLMLLVLVLVLLRRGWLGRLKMLLVLLVLLRHWGPSTLVAW